MKSLIYVIHLIAMLVFLMFLSLADIAFGEEGDCPNYEIPLYIVERPTDSLCRYSSELQLHYMNALAVDCLWITNTGWFPSSKNPVTRSWVNYLLSTDAPY
jgi:hypothetical protein